MRFGILPPYRAGVAADPEWMAEFARHAEAVGFESIYVAEHVVVAAGYSSRYPYSRTGRMPLPDDCPIPDPIDLLCFLAGVTDRLVLATGVLVLPEHHPVALAKRIATLDVLSQGRARLGIGLGWIREEVEATGVDFDTRGARADEMVEVLRAFWADDEVTHRGEHFSVEGLISRPRPVRAGGVPIHIGGHSRAAARRAGRYGQGFQPLGLDDDALADRLAVLRAAAAAAGRDADAIELSLSGLVGDGGTTLDDVERAEELGAVRLVCGTRSGDLAEVKAQLSAFGDEVIHR
jgi:probable F420-dependent oxidoreductase